MINKLYLYIFLALCIVSNLNAQIDTGLIVVKNEKIINSDQLEFSPVFFEDGIVFISSKNEGNKKMLDKNININTMSIFFSQRDSLGQLTQSKQFSEDLVNKHHEGPMCIDRTAENIYFTQNNIDSEGELQLAEDGFAKLGVFASSKSNDTWGNVKPTNLNNIEYNTCHPSISVEGDFIIFSSDRPGGYGGMDLYKSERVLDSWGEPINLGSNINSEKNEVFPFLHADGTLYFSSDGLNGKGGLDIFYSWENELKEWISPTNIEGPINTTFDDFGLIVDRDKKNGYLSSNRPGKGQDDIFNFYVKNDKGIDLLGGKNKHLLYKDILVQFMDNDQNLLMDYDVTLNEIKDIANLEGIDGIQIEKISDNNFVLNTDNKPENIPTFLIDGITSTSINTSKNYIITFQKEGFVKKQFRIKPLEGQSTYNFNVENITECLTLKGTVQQTLTSNAIGTAIIKIRSKSNPDDVQTLASDENGNFEFCLKCGENYEVAVSKEGQTVGKSIETLESDCRSNNSLNLLFEIEPLVLEEGIVLEEGTVIELPHIYYNFNDASLRPDAVQDLEGLISILNENPSIEIDLLSHTDSRGTDRYNNKLSQKRANNVVSYLINRGISTNRITGRGFGETMIRNHCENNVKCDENDHQFNRRTEVKITKIDEPKTSITYKTDVAPLDNSISEYIGSYLVIAGSFLIESNATIQLSKVQNAGYINSRIIKLDNSEYYSVIVEKYDSKPNAQNLIFDLREEKIAAFIKKI